MRAASAILTIGHSSRSARELLGLLRENGVDLLVDVRTVPRSRANPQFNADALTKSLADAGIGYRRIVELGGLRHRARNAPASPNTLWRNDSFRNYADYAMTPPFRLGLDELCELAGRHCCAVMCAEAVWWRCHRRIIADYLLRSGWDVRHIMGAGRTDPATLTSGARLMPDGTIRYEAANETASTG